MKPNITDITTEVRAIYNKHKLKLDNLKDAVSRWDEEQWTDAEIRVVDDQIKLLASVLSDLYKVLNT